MNFLVKLILRIKGKKQESFVRNVLASNIIGLGANDSGSAQNADLELP